MEGRTEMAAWSGNDRERNMTRKMGGREGKGRMKRRQHPLCAAQSRRPEALALVSYDSLERHREKDLSVCRRCVSGMFV